MQLDFNVVFKRILLIGILLVSATDFVYAENFSISHSPGIHNLRYNQTDPIYRQSKFKNENIKSDDGSFILHQLYDDMTFLIKEPDFYGIVGGLAAIPSMFPTAFRRESPEFTELWGPSVFADNFFEQ